MLIKLWVLIFKSTPVKRQFDPISKTR